MRPIRVLIVEDEEDWQKTFYQACLRRGFTEEDVEIAGDKATALEKLATWSPDFVILDLAIPSSQKSGDADRLHGHEVFKAMRTINETTFARVVTVIVSGQVDEQLKDLYLYDPMCVDVKSKDEVAHSLASLIRRGQRRARPIYRDLKNHASDLLPLFEAIVHEETPARDVIIKANEMMNMILMKVGRAVLGDRYPLQTWDIKAGFERMEVLRGRECKVERFRENPERGSPALHSDKNWIGGLPYQHMHTIRNYLNFTDHTAARLAPDESFACLLDRERDAATIEFLENLGRSANVIRPIVEDLLEWYLPWAKRQAQGQQGASA